ncbi:hypothetical protein J2X90_002875 [Variovorax paradoxus]|uniref:hypothetical protein n=1 Tax=Variovorax paradoxus TaxID=34073 RepID=UPI00278A2D02|nr:hypothetical protein [Variovorax paradoxus]MDQ0025069.1 hypothetical protein [Variovorax paradoxus]
MFHSSPAGWLALLSAFAALSAAAQPAPTVPDYKSALEGYRPFADAKPIPWKEANETVYRRGGWQAYAKEAAESTRSAAAEQRKGTAAEPQAHQGHAMPMPAAKEKP